MKKASEIEYEPTELDLLMVKIFEEMIIPEKPFYEALKEEEVFDDYMKRSLLKIQLV
jgi:hypothetical protein